MTTATRVGFARHYELTENVLPPEVLAREVDDDEAVRELALRAATALGVGTEADIRDYFRLGAGQIKPALAKLVADGELEQVEVDGWKAPGISACRPDHSAFRAWDRSAVPVRPADLVPAACRADVRFHYRIEIYTPAPKRQFGYYVWPFMLDGQLVGRVDLKAERASGALNVVGAFTEPGQERCAWRRRWRGSCSRWRGGWD